MFTKILVPLDGSVLAERALPLAVEITKGNDAQLALLRVVPYFAVLAADPLLYEEMNRMGEDEALAYLHRVRNDIPDLPPVATDCQVGSAADSILQYALDNKIDLIVMSSHGRSGLNRWVYGSVAERIMSQAPCPTLIINARQSSWQPVPEKIVVPLDGSALAEKAVAPALDLAAALGSELHLLRVTVSGHVRFETNSMSESFSDIERNEVEQANGYLQEQADKVNYDNVQISVAVADASIPEAIINYAAKQEMDLIVMSSHGRTGLQRWVYGSVAEKVLRSACCATMIVRNS